jgi:hypothetical protein
MISSPQKFTLFLERERSSSARCQSVSVQWYGFLGKRTRQANEQQRREMQLAETARKRRCSQRNKKTIQFWKGIRRNKETAPSTITAGLCPWNGVHFPDMNH